MIRELNKRTLFVDMDGVIADFRRGYEIQIGHSLTQFSDHVDWKAVRNTKHFFRNLPPMPDLDILWSGIAKYNPIILTGVPSSVPEATANKREFVDKHFGKDQPMIACQSKNKFMHMRNPGDIIIDDWEKYMHVWINHGGTWITHVSAQDSLDQLERCLAIASA
jgi:5'(3')-deoxyribonucleotidase